VMMMPFKANRKCSDWRDGFVGFIGNSKSNLDSCLRYFSSIKKHGIDELTILISMTTAVTTLVIDG
jgi:hypothetical protein